MDVIYGISSIRGIRDENQDSVMHLVKDELKAFAVADGLGGLQFGSEASRLTTEAFYDELMALGKINIDEVGDIVNRKFQQVNKHIYDLCRENNVRMATTMSILLMVDKKYLIGNAGDTIIYLLRKKDLKIISRLHNLAYDKKNKLKKPVDESKKNVLTMAIGGYDKIDPYYSSGTIKPGDIFIICSDGLYNYVDSNAIIDLFLKRKTISNEGIVRICNELTAMAIDNGSDDNVSITAVKVV